MTIDWEELRSQSLKPGGFGQHRAHIWPQLLNVSPNAQPPPPASEEPHKDEYQISLDTARSFVLYPVHAPDSTRQDLQLQLQNLIVSLFRARPKLSYFQGYHDIVSVLMLTLPKHLQFTCVEKLSLHWLRDSMGEGLEPVLGLLRVTKNLIRLADPELASMLEQSSQLPFFALSNLLTLFSHDTPTLPLIQHVFDYLLCRPPITVVYLAAAVILSRKDQVRQLLDQDEDGMVHSLLSSLPEFVDDDDHAHKGVSEFQSLSEHEQDTFDTEEHTLINPSPCPEEIPLPDSPAPSSDITLVDPDPVSNCDLTGLKEKPLDSLSSIPYPTPTLTPVPTPTPTHTSHSTLSSPSKSKSKSTNTVSLPMLLSQASNLFTLYSPTHPNLRVSKIMGPQSVIFTWSEKYSSLPSDHEAEKMVMRSDLVVYPFVEGDDEDEEEEDDESYDEAREWSSDKSPAQARTRRRKLTKSKPSRLSTRHKKKKTSPLHLFKTTKLKLKRMKMEKQTIVAGVVLLFGIGLAVYNVKRASRGEGLGGHTSGTGNNGAGWKSVGEKLWPW